MFRQKTVQKFGTDSKTSTVRTFGTKDQPLPTNFEDFIPWACLQFYIDNVMVKSSQNKAPDLLKQTMMDVRSSLDTTSTQFFNAAINIRTIYNNEKLLEHINFLKCAGIPPKMFKILTLILDFHPRLYKLTINSGLNYYGIYELNKFLALSHITCLVLDNCYLPAHYNIACLLDKPILANLSLARCFIGNDGLKAICEKLKPPAPASKSLLTLNVATNKIDNTGAKYIGECLRSNKALEYLNLAGNYLTDEGASHIFASLKEFRLTNEEFEHLKQMRIEYFKKFKMLVNSVDSASRATAVLKGKAIILRKKIKNKVAPDSVSLDAKAKADIVSQLSEMKEALANEDTIQKSDGSFSVGNGHLVYINFNYNSLTYLSLRELYSVLAYQSSLQRTNFGLINVSFNGNPIDSNCDLIDIIENMFIAKKLVLWKEYRVRMQPRARQSIAYSRGLK